MGQQAAHRSRVESLARPWFLAWWTVTATLGALVLVDLTGATLTPGHAALQGLRPLLVFPAAGALVAATAGRRWRLAAAAGVVTLALGASVLPALGSDRPPVWAVDAPLLRVRFANARFDNPTPDRLADALLADEADVLAVAELTPGLLAQLRARGLDDRYPHQLVRTDDGSLGVGLFSAVPWEDATLVPVAGATVPVATLAVGATPVRVALAHPKAPRTRDDLARWRRQLDGLRTLTRPWDGPVVMVGDFNATRWHPPFARLLGDGFTLAHEARGRGLSRSWPLTGNPPWDRLGPLMRLDHALVGGDATPVAVADRPGEGSDHAGFLVTVAVRQAT